MTAPSREALEARLALLAEFPNNPNCECDWCKWTRDEYTKVQVQLAALSEQPTPGTRPERLAHRAPERPELDELLRRAKETVAAMTPEERATMWQAQRESWVRGEMEMDESVARKPTPDAQPERRDGHSKLVYDKATRTIVTIDPHAQPEAAREMQELVEELREQSLEKQGEAWRRLDGGQDLSIGAALADKAADAIEALTAKLDAANARAAENEEMAQYAGEEQFRAEQAEAALATARAERDRAVAEEQEIILAIIAEHKASRVIGPEGRDWLHMVEQRIRARATSSPVKREGE